MSTILIVVQGTEGDVRPMLQVGQALSARGHAVTFLSHCVFEARVRGAGLDFAALDTPGEYERLLMDSMQSLTIDAAFERFQRQGLPQLPAQCDAIRRYYRPHETLLLINSSSYMLAKIAAEQLHAPLATVYLSPGFMATRPIAEQVLSSTFGPLLNQARAAFDLPPVYDWTAWWQEGAHPIALWPDWFAAPEPDWPAGVVQVGFLPIEISGPEALPPEAVTFLEAGEPPVLITGGSGVFVGTDYYEACIEACRRLGRRAILVARYQTFVPAQLPETVRLFDGLPFAKLMPYLAAAIHHGGIGTSLQGLTAGIPQVVMAKGFDRPDNATRLERLGVGRFLAQPAWTADGVTKALESLLTDPGVRPRCQAIARRVNEQDSLGRIVDLLEAIDLEHPIPLAGRRAYQPPPVQGRPEPPDWETADLQSYLAGLSLERLELLIDLLREEDHPEPEAAPPIAILAEQEVVTGALPFTPNQRWFLGRGLLNPHQWNMSILSEVLFPIQPAMLITTVRALLEHHDALRTRFVCEPAGWRAYIAAPTADVPVTYFDMRAVPEEQQLDAIQDIAVALQESLHLTDGPLVRVAYFDRGALPGRLAFIVHHLVSDAFSLLILTQDCQMAYMQLSQGQPVRLPAKTSSYKVWAERLVAYAQSPDLQRELDYWLGLPWDAVRPLPLDYSRYEDNVVGSNQYVNGGLDAEATAVLVHTLPRRYGLRVMDVLVAAWVQTLAAWTGDPAILITLIISGRESPFADIDLARSVGLFALGVPAVLEAGPAQSPEAALCAIRDQLQAIPNQGITHGVLHRLSTPEITERMEALAVRSELVFNYTGIVPTPPESSPLRWLGEVGGSEDPRHRQNHILKLSAGVLDNRLWFSWMYSGNLYQRATIERLVQSYTEYLKTLLALAPSAAALAVA